MKYPFLAFILLFIFSFSANTLLFNQLASSFHDWLIIINTVVFCYIVLQINKWLGYIYFITIGILSIFQFILVHTYGPVDFNLTLSTYYTNFAELKSYSNTISLNTKIKALGIIILYAIILWLLTQQKQHKNWKITIGGIGIFFIANFAFSYRLVKINQLKFNPLENNSFIFYTPLLRISSYLYYNIANIKYYINIQNNLMSKYSEKQDIEFVDSLLNKQIYIIIIGESVSSHYMSSYNKTISENTPFIAQSNNIQFNNYVAPACNTINSLMELLTYNQQNNTIINMLRATNNKVAWVSNQAKIGLHDNPITFLAEQSDTTIFTQSKMYNTHSDMDAIKLMESIAQQYKIVFLHLFGSHPNPCDRLLDNKLKNELDCYTLTIKHLDDQLHYIHQFISSTFNSYKIMYISDHGIIENNGKIIHGTESTAYNVPLIIWDDTITTKHFLNKVRSGNYFDRYWEEYFDIDLLDISNELKFISNDSINKSVYVKDNFGKFILYPLK